MGSGLVFSEEVWIPRPRDQYLLCEGLPLSEVLGYMIMRPTMTRILVLVF